MRRGSFARAVRPRRTPRIPGDRCRQQAVPSRPFRGMWGRLPAGVKALLFAAGTLGPSGLLAFHATADLHLHIEVGRRADAGDSSEARPPGNQKQPDSPPSSDPSSDPACRMFECGDECRQDPARCQFADSSRFATGFLQT